MSAGTGLPGQVSQDRSGGAGQPRVACLHRSAGRTVQPDRSALERLAGLVSMGRLARQFSLDRTDRTIQQRQASLDGSGGTG
jgi:hypothetical protein